MLDERRAVGMPTVSVGLDNHFKGVGGHPGTFSAASGDVAPREPGGKPTRLRSPHAKAQATLCYTGSSRLLHVGGATMLKEIELHREDARALGRLEARRLNDFGSASRGDFDAGRR